MHYHEAYKLANQYKFPAAQINADVRLKAIDAARDKLMANDVNYQAAMRTVADPNSKPEAVERSKKIMENLEQMYMRNSTAVPPASSSSAPSDIPSINNNDDYNKLKPGQQYRDPQGNLRTKG